MSTALTPLTKFKDDSLASTTLLLVVLGGGTVEGLGCICTPLKPLSPHAKTKKKPACSVYFVVCVVNLRFLVEEVTLSPLSLLFPIRELYVFAQVTLSYNSVRFCCEDLR